MRKKSFKVGDIVKIKPFHKKNNPFFGIIIKKEKGRWNNVICETCGHQHKIYYPTKYHCKIDETVLNRIRLAYEQQHGKMAIIDRWVEIASIHKALAKDLTLIKKNAKK